MTQIPPKNSQSLLSGWTLFFCGICMGAADLVPGISGGTLAFILGFYQPLLDSLKTLNGTAFRLLFKGHFRQFTQHVAWKFLLTLLAGIACALISLANFFHVILAHETYRVYLYALFLGLILASFVFCMRQIRVWNGKIVLALCVGCFSAYILTETTLAPAAEGSYAVPIELEINSLPLRNYDSHYHLLTGLSEQTLGVMLAKGLLNEKTAVYNSQFVYIGQIGELVAPYQTSFLNGWLVICGALAICALLLPGISGSYILTLLGVYPIVIEAFVDFLHDLKNASFNGEAFAVLWSLALGIVIGAIAFARVVSWLLRVYPNLSLALLSGFMIGAIRSVWPFWSYDYLLMPLKLAKGPQIVTVNPIFPAWNSSLAWQAAACTLVGFLLVFTLEIYSKRKNLAA